jgi:hypothetical protein
LPAGGVGADAGTLPASEECVAAGDFLVRHRTIIMPGASAASAATAIEDGSLRTSLDLEHRFDLFSHLDTSVSGAGFEPAKCAMGAHAHASTYSATPTGTRDDGGCRAYVT